MTWTSRRELIGGMAGVLGALFFESRAWAGNCFLCRKPVVDMPVSLAVGTVRTPEFPVKHFMYIISIDVQMRFPRGELQCMMGVKLAWEPGHCKMFNFERVLEADWTVWDGEHIVAQGSVHGVDANFDLSRDSLSRILGTFVGESKKKYVLEVKFTKDGTPLNVTNPHLVVMMTRPTDI